MHCPWVAGVDCAACTVMSRCKPIVSVRGAPSCAGVHLGRLLLLLAAAQLCGVAGEIEFAGHAWIVRSGRGGPGPNAWDAQNVWLDAENHLHLKIASRDGRWSCAEVTMRERLGFGRYEFETVGRLDRLDDNVVLGLFNYPTADVGPDATREIDIEFARWGRAGNPLGNFTVWPVAAGLRQVSHPFPFTFDGDVATHRFHWRPDRITFQSFAGPAADTAPDPGRLVAGWEYRPEEPHRFIAQKPMPVHLNLWLFRGRPPRDGCEVEVVVRRFQFTPAIEPDGQDAGAAQSN